MIETWQQFFAKIREDDRADRERRLAAAQSTETPAASNLRQPQRSTGPPPPKLEMQPDSKRPRLSPPVLQPASASASGSASTPAANPPPQSKTPKEKKTTPPADSPPVDEKPTEEEERLIWDHINDNYGPQLVNVMDEVLNARNRDVTLGKCGNLSITGSDLQKIRIGEWLNDTIVDAYLSMVKQRNADDPTLPKVGVLNCMFYDKYRKVGYKGAQRWCRDAFANEIILMPMCDQNHWALVIADFGENTFIYYDSLRFHTNERLQAFTFYYCGILREFLLDDAKAKNLGDEMVEKITNMQICASCQPLQENDSDCGVFLLYFAETYVRRSKTLNFCQALMVQYRIRLFFEIIHNQIFDPYVVPSVTAVLPPVKEDDTNTAPVMEEDASTAPINEEDTSTEPVKNEDTSTAPVKEEDASTAPVMEEDASTAMEGVQETNGLPNDQ